MKKLIVIALATALPMLISAQNPYAALSLGYMPMKGNTGFFSAQLSAGTHIGKHWCIEYNQNIAMSSDEFAPKYIQIRSGPVYTLDRALKLYLVAGYSITSTPKNTNHRIGHSPTAAVYLVQKVDEEMNLKFELSVNNGFHLVPSIGMLVRF